MTCCHGRGRRLRTLLAAAPVIVVVACSSNAVSTSAGPAAGTAPPTSLGADPNFAAQVESVGNMLTALKSEAVFVTAASVSQQLRQLHALIPQSDGQLTQVATGRRQQPVNCPALADDASAAANIAAEEGPLLEAIPGELATLDTEVGPAATLIATVQRQTGMLSRETEPPNPAEQQLAADDTAITVLAENLASAQSELKTVPLTVASFSKQYNAALQAPVAVSRLCTPHSAKAKPRAVRPSA